MEETSNGDNIASDKNHDVRRQRCVHVLRVVLLFVGTVGTVVLAVVLQETRYPTDSIDTSLREPTPIREKAAVPLAADSDDDQVTYPTDSIDTSLREPTPIREKAEVPLAADSDNDQVTFVELRKVSASTL